ncbi:MAG: carboxymuconolactone decarboxylase family protein [Opitutae bacterium]|nr:carboxymuconolactone decarboxylase family protein [Opitutae bacterium]
MKLDPQTKELVAIAAALAVKCQPCYAYHRKRARELGVGDELIREALAVAKEVRDAADRKMDDFIERQTTE